MTQEETKPTLTRRAVFELGLTLLAALAAAVFGVLLEFDPEQITDWRLWALGAGGAIARQVGAQGLAWMVRRGFVRSA